MPSAIIHIGYHKTGSTWFQHAFYPNVRNYQYIDRLIVQDALFEPYAFDFDPDKARRILGVGERDLPPIFCEEELSGDPTTAGLKGLQSRAIADRLFQLMPEARIIVFVREQASAIASQYAQLVRAGATHTVDRFLNPRRYLKGLPTRPHSTPLFSLNHFDYLKLISYYADLFGQNRLHVFAFEDFTDNPIRFLRRFVDRLRLDIDLEQVDTTAQNRALGTRTLRLARLLNHFLPDGPIDKNVVLKLLSYRRYKKLLDTFERSGFAGPPVSAETLFDETFLDLIQQKFGDSNRILADRFDVPLARFGYPGFGSGATSPS